MTFARQYVAKKNKLYIMYIVVSMVALLICATQM